MSEWIECRKSLPAIKKILSEPCQIGGKEIPILYRSAEVIYFDGKIVSAGIVEWFHGQLPLSGVTHWMPLPESPK